MLPHQLLAPAAWLDRRHSPAVISPRKDQRKDPNLTPRALHIGSSSPGAQSSVPSSWPQSVSVPLSVWHKPGHVLASSCSGPKPEPSLLNPLLTSRFQRTVQISRPHCCPPSLPHPQVGVKLLIRTPEPLPHLLQLPVPVFLGLSGDG